MFIDQYSTVYLSLYTYCQAAFLAGLAQIYDFREPTEQYAIMIYNFMHFPVSLVIRDRYCARMYVCNVSIAKPNAWALYEQNY